MTKNSKAKKVPARPAIKPKPVVVEETVTTQAEETVATQAEETVTTQAAPRPTPVYTIDGNKVRYSGDLADTWVTAINNLSDFQCIAVLLATRRAPVPCGAGAVELSECMEAALYAVRTNGGRQDELFETDRRAPSDLELEAFEVFHRCREMAQRFKESFLGSTRYELAVMSHGQRNRPLDCYIRLATGRLHGY